MPGVGREEEDFEEVGGGFCMVGRSKGCGGLTERRIVCWLSRSRGRGAGDGLIGTISGLFEAAVVDIGGVGEPSYRQKLG